MCESAQGFIRLCHMTTSTRATDLPREPNRNGSVRLRNRHAPQRVSRLSERIAGLSSDVRAALPPCGAILAGLARTRQAPNNDLTRIVCSLVLLGGGGGDGQAKLSTHVGRVAVLPTRCSWAQGVAKQIASAADEDPDEGQRARELCQSCSSAKRPWTTAIGAAGATAIDEPLWFGGAVVPPELRALCELREGRMGNKVGGC